jgi:hypothetical protein
MADKDKPSQDFVMDFVTPEYMASTKTEDGRGGGFARVPVCDCARFKIVDAAIQPKEGDKPHNMLALTLAVLAHPDASAVGMNTKVLLAGSKESPKFMRGRLAHYISTLKIPPGRIARSAWIGREFEGSVVWEKAKPTMNSQGETVIYVNDRVCNERAFGAEVPKGFNAEKASAEAKKYLDAKDGGSPGANVEGGGAAPWAPEGSAPTEGATATVDGAGAATGTTGFKPESEINDDTVFAYRAAIKLDMKSKETAREALIGIGFDPDGPVDSSKLKGTIKAKYDAKFPPQADEDELPALGGANGAATAAKTGTRTKPAGATA